VFANQNKEAPSILSQPEKFRRHKNMTQTQQHKLGKTVIPHGWLKNSQYSEKVIKWLFQKACNITQ
jgi:hypothetical protein